ncbi:hypothetical protein BJ508DRAFT_62992 [Ascobolus immersus RN42]|uniref:Major facilitator superfamily (MFS) profile domain-containing protein n=1 Tax=Ascobolus immersus RN42 TaxID=1160509 RepID=A0A3N4J139_ASCIM|nr:hypothetical protein BJ508DRAFT_62992 [Ascobolus immersus RN42]
MTCLLSYLFLSLLSWSFRWDCNQEGVVLTAVCFHFQHLHVYCVIGMGCYPMKKACFFCTCCPLFGCFGYFLAMYGLQTFGFVVGIRSMYACMVYQFPNLQVLDRRRLLLLLLPSSALLFFTN